jgi:hypothetical protein
MKSRSSGTYSLRLRFLRGKAGELGHWPICHIVVRTYSRSAEDPSPTITPECVSMLEVETQVNRLIAELEAIRKEARRRFAEFDKP